MDTGIATAIESTMESNIEFSIESIVLPDADAARAAKERWDQIAKPLHSLGLLEDAIIRIAGIQGTNQVQTKKKALAVFCADNGVVAENVTQTGQEITAVVAGNFLQGKTCTSVFCKDTGTDLYPIDIGMSQDVSGVYNCKTAYGTRNIAEEPAMSRKQALEAIEAGIRIAKEFKKKGYDIAAAGEMGIGNTTTSSAVSAVLLDRRAEETTGFGAGLSTEGLQHKIQVIKKAIRLHQPDASDPIDVLSKVGGFDLAGMAGFYLGAASCRIPVVLDGVISLTAALVAVRLCPSVREYLIASHGTHEPAGRQLLKELQLQPTLDCGLCLGEGSGAVLMFQLLDSAVHVYEQMSSFADIKVEAYVPFV